jgi:hypothetical protein
MRPLRGARVKTKMEFFMNANEIVPIPTNERAPLLCPVCHSQMERFRVTRARTGDVQGIRCPLCKTSSFLSREAANRLDGPKTASQCVADNALSAKSESAPQPTSLIEDFFNWLASGTEEFWK